MCQYNGFLPTEDPYNIACCDNSDHEFCKANSQNLCSGSFNDQRHAFFSYCPLINSTGCGAYGGNGTQIEASTEKKSFTYSNLRYKDKDYKFKSVDSCYYQVMNPTFYYTSGKLYIKFTQIESGVEVHLTAGADVRNNSVSVVPNNQTVEVGELYAIDQTLNYLVYAVPKYNNYNTSFTFEYYTDGVAYPWY